MNPATAALTVGAGVTVGGFLVARRLQLALGMHPVANPVLVAAGALALLGVALDVPADAYAPTATLFSWFLGPHVVLLAVPLYRFRGEIAGAAGVVLPAVAVGGLAAALTAIAVCRFVGTEAPITATLATKSVTTAVALELAAHNGGLPHLASLVVVLTGVFGASVVGLRHGLFGAPCPRAHGLALGVSAHAIGTARALALSERTGAFASLGMILNALMTAATLPLLLAVAG